MARELKNLLIHRLFERQFFRLADEHLRGRMLDIGCGTKPYREELSAHVDQHVGVDHAECLHDRSEVDLEGTAYAIPTDDASFDSVICTAVLEHLEEPEQALRECARVLKPNGVAIYSVPFIWHLHEEPRDFFRFSKYGLRYLFEKTGFEVVELIPLSGFWATFGQLLVYNLYRFHHGVMRFVPIIPALGLLIQAVAWLMNRFDANERWTWMYIVVARKPAETNRSDEPQTLPNPVLAAAD